MNGLNGIDDEHLGALAGSQLDNRLNSRLGQQLEAIILNAQAFCAHPDLPE